MLDTMGDFKHTLVSEDEIQLRDLEVPKQKAV